jgi:hypothetical protein
MQKYIQDSLLLTKEDIANHILKQRIEQAKRYGLTLEEFMQAVVEGKTIVAQSSPQSGSL